MDILIYSFSKLPISLDVIEDALDELLNGAGEVTGSGMGESGINIDIEIFEDDPFNYIEPIQRALKELQMPDDTIIEIHGEKYPLGNVWRSLRNEAFIAITKENLESFVHPTVTQWILI